MGRSLSSAVFLLLTVVGCDKAKDKAPTPVTPGSAAPTTGSATAEAITLPDPVAAAGAWKAYDGPTFTVKSPVAAPSQNTTDVPTDLGPMAMTAYTFQEPGNDNVAHAVMTTKLPDSIKDADQAKMLRDARDGMINRYGAKVDNDAEVKIGATPALDFAAHGTHPQLGDFFVRGRVAIQNHTLFQVMSLGQGHTQSADAATFVESFALKGALP